MSIHQIMDTCGRTASALVAPGLGPASQEKMNIKKTQIIYFYDYSCISQLLTKYYILMFLSIFVTWIVLTFYDYFEFFRILTTWAIWPYSRYNFCHSSRSPIRSTLVLNERYSLALYVHIFISIKLCQWPSLYSFKN